MLQFSATEMDIVKKGKTNRDNAGLLCMKAVRSLDLKLLCLLIIHYIIVQVFFFFGYVTLFEILDPSLFSEKPTRNRHKKKQLA